VGSRRGKIGRWTARLKLFQADALEAATFIAITNACKKCALDNLEKILPDGPALLNRDLRA
jgi:hypothetical protein